MQKTGFWLLIFTTLMGMSWAVPVIVHQPPSRVEAEKPVLITATITDPTGKGIAQAVLFVRTKGTLGYWQVPMQGRGALFSAAIPGKLVLPAGVEYYMEVRDQTGLVTTAPMFNAALNPYQLTVAGNTGGPQLELLSPTLNALLAPEEAVVVVGLTAGASPVDLSTLKVFFDEQDVTGSVNQTSTMLSYVAPETLAPGLHGIRVEIKDTEGRLSKSPTWTFRIRSKGEAPARSRGKRVDLHGHLGAASQLSLLTTTPQPQGSLRQPEGFLNRLELNLNGHWADWRLNGHVDMSSEETPGQQPVDRFLVEASNDQVTILAGDVYPIFSEYSLYNYFIRGGRVSLLSGHPQGAHSRLIVVGGLTKIAIEGRAFEYSGGYTVYDQAGTFEQWMVGSQWAYDFLPGTGFTLNYASIMDNPGSLNTPAGTDAHQNHVLTGEGNLKVFFLPRFTTTFFGEYGLDYYDERQSVTDISIGDAYRAGNRWQWLGNNFIQVQLERLGANYVALGNPGLAGDWQGVTADTQLNFLQDNLSLLGRVKTGHDNLDGQKNLDPGEDMTTTTTMVTSSINYRLAPFLQNCSLGYSYQQQTQAPGAMQQLNSLIRTVTLGTSLLWPLSATDHLLSSLTYSRVDLKNLAALKLSGDGLTQTINLGLQYLNPAGLALSGAWGVTRDHQSNTGVVSPVSWDDRVLDQMMVTLRADYKLLPNQLDLTAETDWFHQQQNNAVKTNSDMRSFSLGGTYYLPLRQVLRLTLTDAGYHDETVAKADYNEVIIDLRYGIGF